MLAAREEMAPSLADIVIRRTPLADLGAEALARAAAVVGVELAGLRNSGGGRAPPATCSTTHDQPFHSDRRRGVK